jgi:tyrocidine synthetase-3
VKESIEQQKKYWLREFGGEIPVLNLPCDFPRPVVQGFEGRILNLEMDKETILGLKAHALEEGTTFFMVLLTAYNILLQKLSSQEDILVGTPIAGRSHADLEHIVGMFVNTLVLRNFPGGEKSFKEFLDEIKARTLEVFENQDYPYEELVENVALVRDTARNPLFDTMFILQNVDIPEIVIPGLTLKPHDYDFGISRFDLTLQCFELEEKLLCSFQYSTKLFKEATIERFINYFRSIISIIVENPQIKISDMEIISEEEKTRLLFDFNDTRANYPKDKTLQQLFEEQVDKTPGNIAIVFEEQHLSYKMLNQRSNQLACTLRQKGAAVDMMIPIMVKRSIVMLIGIMAILKAGGAYLPIDPGYPQERKLYILKDSNVTLLLFIKECESSLGDISQLIDLDDKAIYQGVGENPGKINKPDDPAYVIYTSGSTGKPKGVMAEHRNIVSYICWAIKIHMKSGNVNFPLFTSFSFDLTVTSIFAPLLSGNKVVVYEESEQVPIIGKLFDDNRLDIVKLTPSHLKLIEAPRSITIKHLIVGGENLETQLALKVLEKLSSDVVIYNEYGPTETAVGCMIYQFSPGTDTRQSVPIGIPADNVQIYVLDKNRRPLPPGMPGEIYISGDGVSRGYLNRPQLTAERFIENPFLAGKRMYKTGDLARFIPGNHIEFLGRIDHQVKIRGFRIELGEIESQLLKYDEVNEAVVVAKADETGDKHLCAYVVPVKEFNVLQLREFLSAALADYMIPGYFVPLECIPLTPNGKVDMKALPEPETGIEIDMYVPPQDAIEEKLVRIWSEVLRINKTKISTNANFFQLGGHSLRATIMISKIHKELQVRIPLLEVFKTPNIRDLAAKIKQTQKEKFIAIEPTEKKEYYTLSSAQMRMYIIYQRDVESIAYNMPMMAPLEMEMLGAEVDKKKLGDTIRCLIDHHESFRTSFEMINGLPVQRIHYPGDVDFEIEYHHLKEKNVDRGLAAADVFRDFIRPFHLARAPLLRVALVEFENKEYILMADMHHIISDFTSNDILLREFMARYRDEELPLMRLQYKDFSVWRNSEEVKNSIKSQQEYWLSEFQGEIPLLNLSLDYPRSSKIRFIGNRVFRTIEPGLTSRLETRAAEFEVTLMMFLFSVYNILLTRYTGQEEIVVGTVVRGRRHQDLENIIGFFINMLAIKTRPAKNRTFSEYLLELKEKALNAYENQEYPFEELISHLEIPREHGRHPLVETLFTFQEGDEEALDAPLNSFSVSHFDILLHSTKYHDSILLFFEYSTDLFKKATIEELSGFYMDILTQVLEDPDIRLKEIEINLRLLPSTSAVIQEDNDDWGI